MNLRNPLNISEKSTIELNHSRPPKRDHDIKKYQFFSTVKVVNTTKDCFERELANFVSKFWNANLIHIALLLFEVSFWGLGLSKKALKVNKVDIYGHKLPCKFVKEIFFALPKYLLNSFVAYWDFSHLVGPSSIIIIGNAFQSFVKGHKNLFKTSWISCA